MKMFFLLLSVLLKFQSAGATEVQVAAASNFTSALEKISFEFTRESGHKLMISYGSTGKLYSQILNGAPFEVLLSANQEHPKKIADAKKGVKESIFTYASGKLVLWSPKENLVDVKGEVLTHMNYKHLSIANPKLAPYGLAAKEILEKMSLWEKVEGRLVLGENINQALQFIASGNAELGFVAYSQIIKDGRRFGSFWAIPQNLYTPLKQDTILLEKGKNSSAAKAFLMFLKGEKARRIIEEFGYEAR